MSNLDQPLLIEKRTTYQKFVKSELELEKFSLSFKFFAIHITVVDCWPEKIRPWSHIFYNSLQNTGSQSKQHHVVCLMFSVSLQPLTRLVTPLL
jgi:hypothetical protein